MTPGIERQAISSFGGNSSLAVGRNANVLGWAVSGLRAGKCGAVCMKE